MKSKWRWGEEYRRRQFNADLKFISRLKDRRTEIRNVDMETMSWELKIRGRWVEMRWQG